MKKEPKTPPIPIADIVATTPAKPKKKGMITCVIIAILIFLLICSGLTILFFVLRGKVEQITDDVTGLVEEVQEESPTNQPSDLAGEWVDVYSESGKGDKNTKIFQIDRDNSNGWKIIYTFEGSSDSSTLYIEATSPPLTYGTTVVDHIYENGEVMLDEKEVGPYYLTITTDETSSWTIQVKQLMNDSIVTNSLDDSTGEWVDVLSDEGNGSQNTKIFQISEDNSKGWEIVYTFEGSSDTSTFYIEYVVPELTYGTAVVEYVYEDGRVVFDETTTGSYYLRIETDDDSSWTIKVRQLFRN